MTNDPQLYTRLAAAYVRGKLTAAPILRATPPCSIRPSMIWTKPNGTRSFGWGAMRGCACIVLSEP
ncbi:MAG: hypothetical protein MI924_34910 [Chloroflexales bacterium]|nr:hypothetical protein [Chloroflexales bacterium]